jgi:orotidine-5'-phosphate decarboxylase
MYNGAVALDARERIIVALDMPSLERARELARQILAGQARRPALVKVGLELFASHGPRVLDELRGEGARVFCDLKLHDIPNTVAGAVRALARHGAAMLTLHASGGRSMLEAARKAADEFQPGDRPILLGVTVLTSLADADLEDLGFRRPPSEQVIALAEICRRAGLDGVVAAVAEAAALKKALGQDFLVVTPGIRPAGSAARDQRRIATPAEAVRSGADYIVVGRPITEAPDPARAVEQIAAEIAEALKPR